MLSPSRLDKSKEITCFLIFARICISISHSFHLLHERGANLSFHLLHERGATPLSPSLATAFGHGINESCLLYLEVSKSPSRTTEMDRVKVFSWVVSFGCHVIIMKKIKSIHNSFSTLPTMVPYDWVISHYLDNSGTEGPKSWSILIWLILEVMKQITII